MCKKNPEQKDKQEVYLRLVRKVTARLLSLLRIFQHGIFVKDIENIYEEIYGEKLVQIPDLSVSTYLVRFSKTQFFVKQNISLKSV